MSLNIIVIWSHAVNGKYPRKLNLHYRKRTQTRTSVRRRKEKSTEYKELEIIRREVETSSLTLIESEGVRVSAPWVTWKTDWIMHFEGVGLNLLEAQSYKNVRLSTSLNCASSAFIFPRCHCNAPVEGLAGPPLACLRVGA